MPVYFDLGVRQENVTPVFWRWDPIRQNGREYLTPVSRDSFLKVHLEGSDAEEKLSEGVGVVVDTPSSGRTTSPAFTAARILASSFLNLPVTQRQSQFPVIPSLDE